MRVFACMASSLDGKIGPANTDRFVSIGSQYDLDHLKSLRDQANGILFGAKTFRAWPKVHFGHNKAKVAHHFILSRSLNLDPASALFQDKSAPATIFSGAPRPLPKENYPKQVDLVSLTDNTSHIDQVLNHISQLGVTDLLLEGGGQVLHQFIEAQALQELFLTISPRIIGNKDAPSLFGGKTLSCAPQIQVIENRVVGGETFLHLEFNY